MNSRIWAQNNQAGDHRAAGRGTTRLTGLPQTVRVLQSLRSLTRNETKMAARGHLVRVIAPQNLVGDGFIPYLGLAPAAVCRATPRCCSFGRSATFSVAPAARRR